MPTFLVVFLLPTLCFESFSEVGVGFVWLLFLLFSWSFCVLCPEFSPAVHACTYFYSFIVPFILFPEETFVWVQALQQRVPGSSLSQSSSWYRKEGTLTNGDFSYSVNISYRRVSFQSLSYVCCFLKITSSKQYAKVPHLG